MQDVNRPLHLAVVGGGLTGAALVIHAARAATRTLVIDLVDPAAEIGRGIAYGTQDPAHRINVPSDRMSLFPGRPDHLTRWLFDHAVLPDASSTDGHGRHYVPRAAYGAYVGDIVRRAVADAGPRVEFRHHRARAMSIEPAGAGWILGLSDRGRIAADEVALCCGHAPPALPCPVGPEALAAPRFVQNPWARGAFGAIDPHDRVLVVGTGLSMADVVASLADAGHCGPVTAISRRGRLARPQGQFRSDVDFLDGRPAPATALDLLRLTRTRVGALQNSTGWQPVIDALRFELAALWAALPASERRQVVRHLLPIWEVHRFRMAPQLDDLLRGAMADRRLVVEAAGLIGLDERAGRLIATLRHRGGETGERAFDAVVLCTGPGRRIEQDPLWRSVLAQGLARPDDVGFGLAVDPQSRLVAPDGGVRDTLRAFGPVTRGSFGEMTGAPDIIRHVERIAPEIVGGRRPEAGIAQAAAE